MCEQCLFDPTIDFVFKRIFGNEKEPEILIRFLNALFAPHSLIQPYDPIIAVEMKNTEIPKTAIEDKYSILDVKAVTSKGETVDIEIQREDNDDMLQRSLFYNDRMFIEQIGSGEEYLKLQRVVSVIIMNYKSKFIPEEHFHNVYRLVNVRTKNNLTDLKEFHYVELDKMTECDEDDVLQVFLQFLKDPSCPIIDQKSTQIPELTKAKNHLRRLSQDPSTRDRYNDREKALKDKNSALASAVNKGKAIGREEGLQEGREEGLQEGREEGLQEGREEGLQEGREEGLQEGREEGILTVAKNMLGRFPVEEIATATGLSLKEIETLAQEK